jgi:hypothetical protein
MYAVKLGPGAVKLIRARDRFDDRHPRDFHHLLIWGDSLMNVSFVGSGTIAGDGHLKTGTPSSGQADQTFRGSGRGGAPQSQSRERATSWVGLTNRSAMTSSTSMEPV